MDFAFGVHKASVVSNHSGKIRVHQTAVTCQTVKLRKCALVVFFSVLESFASFVKQAKVIQLGNSGEITPWQNPLTRIDRFSVESLGFLKLALLLINSGQIFNGPQDFATSWLQ